MPQHLAWPKAPTCWRTWAGEKRDVLLLASGSEVSLCLEAAERLKTEGIKARVVSMPS